MQNINKTLSFFTIICSFFCAIPLSGFGQEFTSIQKITANERQEHGQFGNEVDISEEYAIVGAFSSGFDSLNKPNGSGLAHIFKQDSLGQWYYEQELKGSDSQLGDSFGREVAISGEYAVVSTRIQGFDEQGENRIPYAGAAYVFERGEDGVWKEVQKLVAFDREEKAFFGHSVDIWGDYIVVGAHHESKDEFGNGGSKDAGAVYIYKRDTSGYWLSLQKIVAQDRKKLANFGITVQIWDKTIIVGANSETNDSENRNGLSRAGAVYVFEQQESELWAQTQKITPGDRLDDDWFGSEISLYENNLIIGSYLKDTPGYNGDRIKRTGAAYIYRRGIYGYWYLASRLVSPSAQVNDHFGFDVSIADSMAYVSMWHDHEMPEGRKDITQGGMVYAYMLDTCDQWKLSHEIYPPQAGQRDGFAASISCNEDFLFIGNFRGDHDIDDQQEVSDAGSAFILRRPKNSINCSYLEIYKFNTIPYLPEITSDSMSDSLSDSTIISTTKPAAADVEEKIELPVISIDQNPNYGEFNLTVINYKANIFRLVVKDPFGQTVLEKEITESTTTVQLKDNARGPYVVEVSSKAGIEKRIVIVKRNKN